MHDDIALVKKHLLKIHSIKIKVSAKYMSVLLRDF